jgi:hypothetical protein
MSSRDPLAFVTTADSRWNSIGGVVAGGIMGTLLAITALGINFFQATASVLTTPLEALGINLGGIVDSTVGGAADIIQTGAETTQAALLPGQPWAVGPLTFAFSILSVAAGLFVLAWILQFGATSDTIPFSFTDFPLLGVDEGEESIPDED